MSNNLHNNNNLRSFVSATLKAFSHSRKKNKKTKKQKNKKTKHPFFIQYPIHTIPGEDLYSKVIEPRVKKGVFSFFVFCFSFYFLFFLFSFFVVFVVFSRNHLRWFTIVGYYLLLCREPISGKGLFLVYGRILHLPRFGVRDSICLVV